MSEFVLTSKTFADVGTLPMSAVFDGFGCTGGNISPDLAWSGAPAGTKSFILTVFDPDAPTGSGWWHWTVYDLPADCTGLAANASADGALPAPAREGRNDYGIKGFGGACPPPGPAHRYIFTIYAMPVESIGLDADMPGAPVGFNANAQALAKASIMARYGRG